MSFLDRSPFYSPEGATVIGLLILAWFKRQPLIEYGKTTPHLTGTITAAFISEVVKAFFSYAAELRRTNTQITLTKREIALKDAEAFTTAAENAREQKKWIDAAENYGLAAKALARANAIAKPVSLLIQQQEAAAIFWGAYCYFFGGQVALSCDVLKNLRVNDYAHLAYVHVLRGLQQLQWGRPKEAYTCFHAALSLDPAQHNVYLLSLFSQGKYEKVIDEFALTFMNNSSASFRMQKNEYLGFALYYYAQCLLKTGYFQLAIAMFEMPLHSPMPFMYRQQSHSALADAYEKLAQNGNRGTMLSLSIAPLSNEIDIVRAPENLVCTQNELETKATRHKQAADRLKNLPPQKLPSAPLNASSRRFSAFFDKSALYAAVGLTAAAGGAALYCLRRR